MNHETNLYCPYCFEKISMLFETLYGSQRYIEDCEVCCNPIEILYTVQDQIIIIEEIKKAY